MVLLLLTRCRVAGKENIPRSGPLLVVANHLSLADPPILSVTLSRRSVFMAKEQLFRSRLVGYIMRSLGAFPVQRGRLGRRSLRQAQDVLEQGLALVVFPEGMRSCGGCLRRAFTGAALIARRTGALILPVAFSGTEALDRPSWVVRRPEIGVRIGRAFHLPPTSGRATRAELARLTDHIMGHIAGLLPESYRGYYAGKEVT